MYILLCREKKRPKRHQFEPEMIIFTSWVFLFLPLQAQSPFPGAVLSLLTLWPHGTNGPSASGSVTAGPSHLFYFPMSRCGATVTLRCVLEEVVCSLPAYREAPSSFNRRFGKRSEVELSHLGAHFTLWRH